MDIVIEADLVIQAIKNARKKETLGRNSNGYNEWKNKDGIKLKDLIN